MIFFMSVENVPESTPPASVEIPHDMPATEAVPEPQPEKIKWVPMVEEVATEDTKVMQTYTSDLSFEKNQTVFEERKRLGDQARSTLMNTESKAGERFSKLNEKQQKFVSGWFDKFQNSSDNLSELLEGAKTKSDKVALQYVGLALLEKGFDGNKQKSADAIAPADRKDIEVGQLIGMDATARLAEVKLAAGNQPPDWRQRVSNAFSRLANHKGMPQAFRERWLNVAQKAAQENITEVSAARNVETSDKAPEIVSTPELPPQPETPPPLSFPFPKQEQEIVAKPEPIKPVEQPKATPSTDQAADPQRTEGQKTVSDQPENVQGAAKNEREPIRALTGREIQQEVWKNNFQPGTRIHGKNGTVRIIESIVNDDSREGGYVKVTVKGMDGKITQEEMALSSLAGKQPWIVNVYENAITDPTMEGIATVSSDQVKTEGETAQARREVINDLGIIQGAVIKSKTGTERHVKQLVLDGKSQGGGYIIAERVGKNGKSRKETRDFASILSRRDAIIKIERPAA